MQYLTPVKAYFSDMRSDLYRFGYHMSIPISRRTARLLLMAILLITIMLSMFVAYAKTPLFEKLSSGAQSLLNDAQDLVGTLATLALIICILGVFIASMMGPKATATMTTSLKFVVGFFIFWTLIPVILSTIEELFGSGSSNDASTKP